MDFIISFSYYSDHNSTFSIIYFCFIFKVTDITKKSWSNLNGDNFLGSQSSLAGTSNSRSDPYSNNFNTAAEGGYQRSCSNYTISKSEPQDEWGWQESNRY